MEWLQRAGEKLPRLERALELGIQSLHGSPARQLGHLLSVLIALPADAELLDGPQRLATEGRLLERGHVGHFLPVVQRVHQRRDLPQVLLGNTAAEQRHPVVFELGQVGENVLVALLNVHRREREEDGVLKSVAGLAALLGLQPS
eukprot:8879596-Pyramimonas_sp.AAC.2